MPNTAAEVDIYMKNKAKTLFSKLYHLKRGAFLYTFQVIKRQLDEGILEKKDTVNLSDALHNTMWVLFKTFI